MHIGIGAALSSAILTSIPSISSISPTISGIYGGLLVTIDGNGFSNSITSVYVTMGSNPCTIISTMPGQLTCVTPAQGSNPSSVSVSIISNAVTFPNTLTMNYSSSITPIITSIYPTSGTAEQILLITGSNFIENETSVLVGGVSCPILNISTTSIMCTVASNRAGYQAVVIYVTSVGKSNSNIRFQYNLQVQNVTPSRGSFGGGQTITIFGDGFNGSYVTATICNRMCQSLIVMSNTEITCVTPSANIISSVKTCNLTVSVDNSSQSIVYTYDTSLTANVTSISPTRGGTGGGTTLIIYGTNFPLVFRSVV